MFQTLRSIPGIILSVINSISVCYCVGVMFVVTPSVAHSVLRQTDGWFVNDQLWRTRTIGEWNIECSWYFLRNHSWSAALGVCQILLQMWPRHVHTFTCKCLSVSDKWRYSSRDLKCTSFYLKVSVSVWQVALLIMWPRHVPTFTCKFLSVWQMALIIRWPRHVHTITCKCLTVSDRWR
jgi:hypothetical protein